MKGMIINQYIISLVTFLKARWKLLLLCITILIFLYEYQKYSKTVSKIEGILRPLQPEPLTNINPNPFTQLYHPQCMESWLNSDPVLRDKALGYVKSKFHDFEGAVFKKRKESSDGYYCSDETEILPRLTARVREKFFGHFPHFAEMYFRFYSVLLWQKRAYKLPSQTAPCIYQLEVSKDQRSFWAILTKVNSWSRDLLLRINQVYQVNTLVSNVGTGFFDFRRYPTIDMPNREGYFLHPADSMVLASLLLNTDACQYAGKSKELLFKDLNVLVVNRKNSRKILNLSNVTKLLHEFSTDPSRSQHSHSLTQNANLEESHGHHKLHPKIGNISETYFESKTLFEQAFVTNQADIVVSVHGAQLTNLVFMKPCSIVIEVMPWLYNVPSYFGRFSDSANILHYSWEEGPANSVMMQLTDSQLLNSHTCIFYRMKYEKLLNSGKFTSTDLDNWCYHDTGRECRSCARQVDGLIISLDKLESTLKVALKARHKCVSEHPFYN